MSTLFCKSSGTSVITSMVKVAANLGGVLIASNNPTKVADLLPAVQAILTKVTGGGDNAAMNVLIGQGIAELVSGYGGNPLVKAEMDIVLSAIGLNVADAVPTLSNPDIESLLSSFISGLQAGVAAAPKSS